MGMIMTTAHALPHGTALPTQDRRVGGRGATSIFFKDLLEDLLQKPLQAQTSATHDLFREHINAMAISYFALIVIIVAASILILPFIIPA